MKINNNLEKYNIRVSVIANIVFFSVFVCDIIALVILLFFCPNEDIPLTLLKILNVIAAVFLFLFNYSTNYTFETKFKNYEKAKKVDVDKINDSISNLVNRIYEHKIQLNSTKAELQSIRKNTDRLCNDVLQKLEVINKKVDSDVKRIRKRNRYTYYK